MEGKATRNPRFVHSSVSSTMTDVSLGSVTAMFAPVSMHQHAFGFWFWFWLCFLVALICGSSGNRQAAWNDVHPANVSSPSTVCSPAPLLPGFRRFLHTTNHWDARSILVRRHSKFERKTCYLHVLPMFSCIHHKSISIHLLSFCVQGGFQPEHLVDHLWEHH